MPLAPQPVVELMPRALCRREGRSIRPVSALGLAYRAPSLRQYTALAHARHLSEPLPTLEHMLALRPSQSLSMCVIKWVMEVVCNGKH